MRPARQTLALLVVAALVGVTACAKKATTQTGRFLDIPVAGIDYTASPSGLAGTTGIDGRFNFQDGDTVSFRLGDVALGNAAGAEHIAGGSLIVDGIDNSARAIYAANLEQMLISLDDDTDAGNGIRIDATTRAMFTRAVIGDASLVAIPVELARVPPAVTVR